MAFDPSTDRASVEAFHTARRLTELRLRPVEGRFDVGHLREINRRIFQDLPGLGFDDVTPGAFRPPAPSDRDWVKHRSLESVGISSYVAYSTMDAETKVRLAERLSGLDPARLRDMPTGGFVRYVAKLYADLDYIHPFSDGNSRTLREFTRQLADEAGFDLRWETFAQTKGGRDALYVARDLSVNRQALAQVRHDDTRRDLTFTLDQLEGNRDLTGLLLSAGRAVMQPKRAAAFERMEEADAVARYPELGPMYRQLRHADAQSVQNFAASPEGRAKFLSGVRDRMQAALDAGDLSVKPQVRQPERTASLVNRDR